VNIYSFFSPWINEQERSSKQVNLMATPTDKSLKVLTATIQDVFEWKQFEDKMAVIYEIFGKPEVFPCTF